MFKKLTKPFRHNFGLCIGLVICAAGLVWAYGCDSTTKSPSDSKLQVTRAELDVEVENLSPKIALAYSKTKSRQQY